jgi:hypothetical protein
MLQEQFKQAVSNAMVAEPQTPNGHDTTAPKAKAQAKSDEQPSRTASAARKRSKSSK